jgi:hypothetical protein
MSSPERFPDIEIYLKRVTTEEITSWLEQMFGSASVERTEPNTRCKLGTMFCTVTEDVAKGGYTSVWFESNETPWVTDLECARQAFDHFKVETRCSTGGWEGEDDGGWLRITDKGEQVVNWHT